MNVVAKSILDCTVREYDHPDLGKIWATCIGNYVISVIGKNGLLEFQQDGTYLWVKDQVTEILENNFVGYIV